MKATIQKNETQPVQSERHQNGQYLSPDVNIYETKEGYVLEAEMPGVNKEGLEITLDGNEITLVGNRAADTTTGQPLFCERHAWNYRRVFELDPQIDTARISASIQQGVLTLTLPKSEEVKPRKISVGD